jgi:hypothetical protein
VACVKIREAPWLGHEHLTLPSLVNGSVGKITHKDTKNIVGLLFLVSAVRISRSTLFPSEHGLTASAVLRGVIHLLFLRPSDCSNIILKRKKTSPPSRLKVTERNFPLTVWPWITSSDYKICEISCGPSMTHYNREMAFSTAPFISDLLNSKANNPVFHNFASYFLPSGPGLSSFID